MREQTVANDEQLKIAFDIDGVVLNSIEVILEYINDASGKSLTPSDLLSWELERLGLTVKTLWKAVDYMYSQPRIRPYDGAVAALSRIHRETGEPLLFVTGRRNPETGRRQLEALDWNPAVPEMIVTGGDRHKLTYLLENRVNYMIEDDVEHLQEYLDAGIGVGLMVRPWNRSATIAVTDRFHGWEELSQWFLRRRRLGRGSSESRD